MSSGLSGLKDLPYFLIGSALLLGTMLLLNKGCAYLAGTDIRQDNQVKQIEALGFPENTKLIKKFESGSNYARTWVDFTYETSLPQNVIVNFYEKKLIQSNWQKGTVTKGKTSYNKETTTYHWQKDEEKLELYFYIPENSNKFNYIITIDWRR